MQTRSPDQAVGERAVSESLISREELEAAIEVQRMAPQPRTLGEILLEMQLLTPDQLERLSETAPPKTASGIRKFPAHLSELFGHLAMERRYVTLSQVDECLAEQKRLEVEGQQMRLGQIMVRKRYLTTDQFLEVLRLQEERARVCTQCGETLALPPEEVKNTPACPKCGGVLAANPVRNSSRMLPVPPPAPPPDLPRAVSPSDETLRMPTPPSIRPASTRTKSVGPPGSPIPRLTPAAPLPRATPTSPIPRSTPAPLGGFTPHTPLMSEGKPFGRYRLLEELGKGNMGVVYRGLDVPLNRIVAIKMLRPSDPPDETHAARFLREAKAAARLNHPSIVTVHEVGTIDGCPYVTTEFIDGQSLDKLLAERRLSREHALEILEKVARAIDYAHSCGGVHRALKPANIMIDRQGQPRLTDFGMNRSLTTASTHDGAAFASSCYMAPEQVRDGPDAADTRADIYTLGVMLYEILVGELPFQGISAGEIRQKILSVSPERPRDRVPDVPPELETVALKAMEKEKALRYLSAAELADDLRRFLNGEPISARRVSAVARVVKRMQRTRRGLVVVAGLLAAGLLTYGGCRLKRAYDERVAGETAKKRRDDARNKLEDIERAIQEMNLKLRREGTTAAELQHAGDQIIAAFDEAIRIDPTFAEAIHRRGLARLLLMRWDEAEADFIAAVKEDPGRIEARFDRGRLHLRQYLLLRGRPLAIVGPYGETLELLEGETSLARSIAEKAMEEFRAAEPKLQNEDQKALATAALAALERVPRWMEALERLNELVRGTALKEETALLRAMVLAAQRTRTKEAFAKFDELLAHRTRLHEAEDLLALTPFGKREIAWASSLYDQAIQRGPVTAELHLNRATLRMLLRNPREARQDLDAVERMQPNHPEQLVRRVLLLMEEGKPTEALGAAQRLADVAPADSRGRLLRALALLELTTNPAQALADAVDAARNAQDDPFVRYVLARAHLSAGKPEFALIEANAAASTVKSFYHAIEARAEAKILARDRDLEGAKADIRDCLRLRKGYWRAHETEGRRLLETQSIEKAIEAFRLAQGHNPDAITPSFWLGVARIEANQPLEATKDLTHALEMRADWPEARAYRGLAYALLNDAQKSLEDLEWARRKAGNDPAVLYCLARVFLVRGELEHAQQTAELFQSASPRWASLAAQILAEIKKKQAQTTVDWQVHMREAEQLIMASSSDRASQMRNYTKAREAYDRAFRLLPPDPKLSREEVERMAVYSYNYACTISVTSQGKSDEERKQDVDHAFHWLRRSFQCGFLALSSRECQWMRKPHSQVAHLQHDQDLDPIRSDPRLQQWINEFKPKE
ncbi:MAG: protein kinase [Planctomycetes bacterium]|nr:protein kinase [Planctomycetota bacterium]